MTKIETFDFEMSWIAADSDADELGHVNNVVYLRWVQDVAASHWNKIASPELKNQCSWVVLRHEIDYMQAAMPGNLIIGKTFIENYEGVKSLRLVHLYRENNNQLLCKARTTWCMIDPKSYKPKRIGDEIKQLLPAKQFIP